MKLVDKLGVPIEEGAILYRTDDGMKYKVTRLNANIITYELTTTLPEPPPDPPGAPPSNVMVAQNFIRLYEVSVPPPRVQ